MYVLINSSKTMNGNGRHHDSYQQPQLLAKAQQLGEQLKTLSESELAQIMHISPKLAATTHALIARWGLAETPYHQAFDLFSGDIYRTLQAHTLSDADRTYANQIVRILSGQYGVLRPFDTIQPYRLEIGYPLAVDGYKNLYDFWSDSIAATLRQTELIINVASEEYFRAVKPFLGDVRVVSPLFLTSQSGGEPTFVAIHAKWARGAFARWMVTSRTTNPTDFPAFTEMAYVYNHTQSTSEVPVFIRQA